MIRSSQTHHFDTPSAVVSRLTWAFLPTVLRTDTGSPRSFTVSLRCRCAPREHGHTTHHPSYSSWGLEPLIDIGKLAAYLGVPVSTIYDWRTRGLGPPAYRFGKHLKFAVGDVRAWVERQRETDTAGP